MILSFPHTKKWLVRELAAEGSALSLFKRAMEKYEAKCLAQYLHTPDVCALSAAYGGILKTWHSQLIEAITTDFINQVRVDPGRLRIQAIQRNIFGRAQGSDHRKQYAVTNRNGGGRAAPLPEISPKIKQAALQMFLDHREDLKQKVLSSTQTEAKKKVSQT